VHYPPDEWSAATDHADVRIGENRFSGDLRTYRIQAAAEEISVDVTLTGEVPPWRPASGYMLFGADRSLEFAWLPSVPQGAVTVRTPSTGSGTKRRGFGYHDHNWSPTWAGSASKSNSPRRVSLANPWATTSAWTRSG
jgi:hypothetical protein